MLGVKMDDLDHSIHIAEYEWTSFYEDSEECSLLQPSLAGLDNLSLSDSEDSVSPAYPVIDTGQHEAQQSTAANSDMSQSNAMGLSMAGEHCTGYIKLSVQVNHSGSGGQPDELFVTQGDSEICLQYPGENTLATKVVQMETAEQITEVTNYSITNDGLIAQQTDFTAVQGSDGACDVSVSTDLKNRGGDEQRECGTLNLKSIEESDPLTRDQAELNMNMLHTTEGAACEKESSAAPRTEKERWFVTVNDSPLRQRAPATSVKKKRRKKKPSTNINPMCSNGKEPLLEYDSELEINKVNESEREKGKAYLTQSYQNSAEILPESFQRELVSESSQMYITSLPFSEEENVSQKLEMSHFPKAVTTEPKCEPYSSAVSSEKPVSLPTSPLHDEFTLKGENTTLLDSVESEEFEDSVEIFSTHSYDSENYLSAPESTEEPLQLFKDYLTEKQPVDIKQLSQQCTSNSHLLVLSETADVHNTQDTEVHSCDTQKVNSSTHSSNVAADSQSSLKEFSQSSHIPQQSEGYVEPTMTFPFVGQTTNIMPEDNSTSDNDTHSAISQIPLGTPEHQEHESTTEFKLSASGCQGIDQLGSPPLPIPDLTVTPCSVADSPETYDEALGPTRPVYAISAFWDEMEKLTIKDILQLRMGRSPSPRETHDIQGTARPHEDVTDTQTHNSVSVDTVEYLLPDGASMDTSDSADSDYCTQLDDSKPDRSSCEFSTFSDFDEEYWQFIGASGNSSPDPHNKNQQSQRTTDSPFSTHDSQEASTNPVGKDTIVALEEFAGQCFDDASHIFLSNELACARGIAKSKSMHNVQALNTEDPLTDVPLQSILENAEKSLFLSNCQSLEENTVLKVSDSVMLGTITAAPILSNTDILDENYRISFPEVFEYLFTEDEPKNDSRSVTIYDSKDISVAPAYDYALSKYRPEMSLSSLQDSQCSEGKPIPIFSCSHLTVRDLTFPELDYLFFPQDMYADSEEEDDSSPIRVVSRSHIRADDSASSAAAPDGLLLNKKGWSSSWTSLLSMRKIRFPDKGSTWCRRSGAWVFPVEADRIPIKRANPAITVFNERRVCSFPSQFFRELAVRQRIQKKQEGLFSTLKQSDMCLVCIAVSSWVLRSSDPQAADAWKAALLANVSAISAIQYLRQYLKKDPPQDQP
uniref:uncharacterized protein perm1b n=1 Tax=Centroberyx gerrardi TaxID=166262 RepID=UPI003AAF1676